MWFLGGSGRWHGADEGSGAVPGCASPLVCPAPAACRPFGALLHHTAAPLPRPPPSHVDVQVVRLPPPPPAVARRVDRVIPSTVAAAAPAAAAAAVAAPPRAAVRGVRDGAYYGVAALQVGKEPGHAHGWGGGLLRCRGRCCGGARRRRARRRAAATPPPPGPLWRQRHARGIARPPAAGPLRCSESGCGCARRGTARSAGAATRALPPPLPLPLKGTRRAAAGRGRHGAPPSLRWRAGRRLCCRGRRGAAQIASWTARLRARLSRFDAPPRLPGTPSPLICGPGRPPRALRLRPAPRRPPPAARRPPPRRAQTGQRPRPQAIRQRPRLALSHRAGQGFLPCGGQQVGSWSGRQR
jgi:hypothetical protein